MRVRPMTGELLIFVEDPGAANYVADLPAALARAGCRARLFADGTARDHLRSCGGSPEARRPGSSAAALLAEIKPSAVMVGTAENPDTLGLELVAAARRAGIDSVGVVDAPANPDRRFRGRGAEPLAYAPDWLLVPEPWTREAFVALGYAPRQVLACGHPHYERVRRVAADLTREGRAAVRARVLPGIPPDQSLVVFASESSTKPDLLRKAASGAYTFTGRGEALGRTQIILEELLDAAELIEPRPHLVLRLHPKNTPDEFTPYRPELDEVSHGGSPLELIYAADLVAGMTSMLLLEAAIMGRPTLAIVPQAAELEWLPGARLGLTRCVTSRAELRAALLTMLRGSDRAEAQDSSCIPAGALGRVTEFVVNLMENRLEPGAD